MGIAGDFKGITVGTPSSVAKLAASNEKEGSRKRAEELSDKFVLLEL